MTVGRKRSRALYSPRHESYYRIRSALAKVRWLLFSVYASYTAKLDSAALELDRNAFRDALYRI